jgi:dTDP-glucose 4,6-dehydratase
MTETTPTHRPTNILLTGGAGFIGSNLVHHLLETDESLTVVTLDALTYAGTRDNLDGLTGADRHRFVHGNICDEALVASLLREHSIDTVLHLAAESHVDRSITGPAAFVETNVNGTYTLLEQARQFWLDEQAWDGTRVRFCHISTDEVFGALGDDDAPWLEDHPYQPNSPYSATKAAADHLVRAYHRTYVLPVVVTHGSNTYGPRQHAEKFMPVIIRSCMDGKPIPIYGDGRNVRDWLFVRDHCRGIEAAMRRGTPGRHYNIGGDDERPNLEIVRAVCQAMDAAHPEGAPHDKLMSFVPDRPGHDWRYAMAIDRATAELGWQPQMAFDDGLKKTIAWYLGR